MTCSTILNYLIGLHNMFNLHFHECHHPVSSSDARWFQNIFSSLFYISFYLFQLCFVCKFPDVEMVTSFAEVKKISLNQPNRRTYIAWIGEEWMFYHATTTVENLLWFFHGSCMVEFQARYQKITIRKAMSPAMLKDFLLVEKFLFFCAHLSRGKLF